MVAVKFAAVDRKTAGKGAGATKGEEERSGAMGIFVVMIEFGALDRKTAGGTPALRRAALRSELRLDWKRDGKIR